MANQTLRTIIQFKRGSAETMEAGKNAVLAAGEPCYDMSEHALKSGDGVTTLENLPAFHTGEIPAGASHYEGIKQEGETDAQVIARVVTGTPNKDDVFIVKSVIASDKYSFTAYVYDGAKWVAMDGNYDAENVYFSEDLVATENVGTVKVGSTGSATISAAGKSVKQVLSSILAKEKNPTATAPKATITLTQAKAYEVGTSITPSYTTTFDAGSYTYGPATGITATSYSVGDGTNTRETSAGSFPALTVGDSTNYKLSLTVAYGAGAIPKTNLGNEYAAAQIKAGNATANSGAITGYRSFFYGVDDGTGAIDSNTIRALTNGGAYNAKKELNLAASSKVNATRVIVAYPVSNTRGGLTLVNLTSTLNADITKDFVQQANVNVEGANGYEAVAYKCFVYQPAKIDASETYKITLS